MPDAPNDARRPGSLAQAILDQYRAEWMRAACELTFRARDMTAARRSRRGTVSAHDALERAAAELYRVESGYAALVGRMEWLPFSATADGEEQKARRLCRHAVRFYPWFYRPALGPYEYWHRIAMVRMKAFHDAAAQLSWETPGEGQP